MDIYRIFIKESSLFFNNVFPAYSSWKRQGEPVIPINDSNRKERRNLSSKKYWEDGDGGRVTTNTSIVGRNRKIVSRGKDKIPNKFSKFVVYFCSQMFSVMTCYDVEQLPLNSSEENANSLARWDANDENNQNSSQVFEIICGWSTRNTDSYFQQMFIHRSRVLRIDGTCYEWIRWSTIQMSVTFFKIILDVKDELTEKAELIIDKYRQETLQDLQLHYQKDFRVWKIIQKDWKN